MNGLLKRWAGLALAVVVLVAGLPAESLAKTEIQFWIGIAGQLADAVETQAKEFNQSQNDYEVKVVRKGTYSDALTAAIAAYRQKNPPHIVQVFEVGTQTMLLSGAVFPVQDLMTEHGIRINWDDFIKPVRDFYSKDGKLYSLPYNSSAPIFYYNKDAFKKAGLAATHKQ